MTAIAGLWRLDGRSDAAEKCARMLAVQQLYGPDNGAQWSAGDVALGRQLMRVLRRRDLQARDEALLRMLF